MDSNAPLLPDKPFLAYNIEVKSMGAILDFAGHQKSTAENLVFAFFVNSWLLSDPLK